jgi:glycosyltransferase involved in cell wall biosynthesis
MRVLQVHNFYRSSAPSGEDQVVRAERALLIAHGVEVIPYERHNDILRADTMGALRAATSNVWSRGARRELANLIARERPLVAHFHNTFPQISVSGYAACRQQNLPVVQTLHNFRLFCANGLMLRDGAPCDDCLGHMPWPGLRHACYRDSRLATAGISLAIATHRLLRTHRRFVSRFIVLTDFARRKFLAAGIPAGRIALRGNSLSEDPGVGDGAGGYALYVGRLTAEKGVATLVQAWRRNAPAKLLVVGDGELRASLEIESRGLPVEFLGYQPVPEVLRLMRAAALVVIPSQCFEGFPRVYGEALATGTPVVAARIGGLAELLADGRTGRTFTPGDVADLARTVAGLFADTQALARLRMAARERFETQYSPRSAARSLRDIYDSVLPAAILPGRLNPPDPSVPNAMTAPAAPRP